VDAGSKNLQEVAKFPLIFDRAKITLDPELTPGELLDGKMSKVKRVVHEFTASWERCLGASKPTNSQRGIAFSSGIVLLLLAR
jgi:hypothetical protein